jgi:hypothetical protein
MVGLGGKVIFGGGVYVWIGSGVSVTVLLGDGDGESDGEGVILGVGVTDAVGEIVGEDVAVLLGERVPVCVNVGKMVKLGHIVEVDDAITVKPAPGAVVEFGRMSPRCAFHTAAIPAQ